LEQQYHEKIFNSYLINAIAWPGLTKAGIAGARCLTIGAVPKTR